MKHQQLPIILLIVLFTFGSSATLIACKHINQPAHNTTAIDPRYNSLLKKTVDSIAVIKKDRLMSVYNKGKLLKLYHISLGAQPKGAKHFQGDNKTPEGHYFISVKNPNSLYHKSLGVSYPNDADRRYAKSKDQPTGGDIMIHGLPNGYKGAASEYTSVDWTAGCISVSNPLIDELYEHVEMRTPITILP